MIPKPILLHKLKIYNIGEDLPFDTIYCRAENLHFWIGADYANDGHRVLVSKVWVSPTRFRQLFPRDMWETSQAWHTAEE